ncbi:MAG: methyltransferase domain-containing protein, partial [Candidatus Omnitrophica bacterium]|nr:methyltransferase domain-containing protein [Candidatus Omnitrophota bacterium]
ANILTITVISLASVAILDGTMFTIAFRLVTQTIDKKPSAMAKIYLIESIGLIIGGLTFAFIMLSVFNAFQIAFILSSANILASLFLLKDNSRLLKKIIFSLVFLISITCLIFSGPIQKLTLKIQWHKKNIVAYENSIFGNIAVSKENNQYTIFYDGLPTLSLPAGDTFFIEDFIHIPLLLNPNAKSILFIGQAAGGLIQEALKYPEIEITYCEIDPVFIKTLLTLKNKQIQKELNNPRVHIQLTDGRSFIKTTDQKYDVIFVNVGLPTSLSINRYYTQEFFTEIKRHLKPRGLAVFKTWGTLSYLSDEFLAMNATIYKTLRASFNYLEAIPGDGFNIFIATGTKQKIDTAAMIGHCRNLNIQTSLINLSYLNLRLDPSYQQWFFDSLKPELEKAVINQDLKPAGLYAALRLYYAQFSIQIPSVFKSFSKIEPNHLILLILALFVFLRWLSRSIKNTAMTLSITALTSGIFTMSTQVTVLLLFQSFLGILFQWLAVLTTSFMAGIAAGTFLANKKLKTLSSLKALSLIEILLPAGITLLALLTAYIFNNTYNPNTLKWLFSLLSFSAGGLIGLEIPIIFSLITRSHSQSRPSHISAGRLYCLDLTGACIGALITPLILIPNYGIILTILLMCLLKISNSINLSLLHKKDL